MATRTEKVRWPKSLDELQASFKKTQAEAEERDVCTRYAKLKAAASAHSRGRDFDKLLQAVFPLAGFSAKTSPATAKPRQTDVLAIDGRDYFISEAKWEKKKFDLADLAQVKDRLGRTTRDVVACVFSISGYTQNLIQEVEGFKDREVLLFNKTEVERIIEAPYALSSMIEFKRRALRCDSKVAFWDAKEFRVLGTRPLNKAEIQLSVDSRRVASVAIPATHFPHSLLALDFLEPGHDVTSGNTFELGFRIPGTTHGALEDLLKVIDDLFDFTCDGPFSIDQSEWSWHGFGIRTLLSELRRREARYSEHKDSRWHHSEDFAYFDRFRDGVFLLSGRQAVEPLKGRAEYYSLELTFLFPGIPINDESIKRFARAATLSNPMLIPSHARVKKADLPKGLPKLNIIGTAHGDEWASGVICGNPFFGKNAPKTHDGKDAFDQLSRLKHLICRVHDHYPPDHKPVGFRLTDLERLSLGSRTVFLAGCRWDKCPHPKSRGRREH